MTVGNWSCSLQTPQEGHWEREGQHLLMEAPNRTLQALRHRHDRQILLSRDVIY